MYYMYTLPVISSVDYEKMNSEHHESEKNTCIDHRYRWDCINLHMDAILQIRSMDYMYCVNVRSVHLVMTWFSTMKKKRERETFKIEKKIVFFFKNSYLK